ncbi:MAG: macro domain-containing protein [Deltaproteobacteria bacterium]|nr:macro domain-containing protein [Deltaproteobacteria bacterium]
MPHITVVEGDLLDQQVDVIVNAWNRNPLPWWLMILSGVSRAIHKRAGSAPFRELAAMPLIPLGGAVLTGPGKLAFQAIIHVAGINLLWTASERSIHDSVVHAIALAKTHGFESIALPLIGAGAGGGSMAHVQSVIEAALATCEYDGRVVIVRYTPR